MLLDNNRMRIAIDQATGDLRRIEDVATGRVFTHAYPTPLYTLQLVKPGGYERTISSRDAQTVAVEDTGTTITVSARHEDGIAVTCTVSLRADDPLSRWRIRIENSGEYGIRTIRYPVVYTAPLDPDGEAEDFYVSGQGFGLMAERPGRILQEPPQPEPKSYPGEEVLTTDFCAGEYPGPVTVQMHTYYDDRAGLYMATYDTDGRVKQFGYAAADGAAALDMTIQHRFDERAGLDFELPYDTVIGTYQGDWYDAADIYAAWGHEQHWAADKLGDRDLPGWLLEPRPHLMVISRGGVDRAQSTLPCPPSEYPLQRFWPARKVVPLMRLWTDLLESPAACWLEGWEQIGSPGGPVDIFPPLEGEESFKQAIDEMVADGNIVSLYLAALHWCYRRSSTGYYGEERFETEGLPLAARNPEGDLDRYIFASAQKHFVNLCAGSDEVRDLYVRNFMQLMDYGAQWIQLDQQVGLYTAPCWSDEHDHEPGYGRWMYEKMLDLTRAIRSAAKERDPDAAYTCENVCEVWMQEVDAFMSRPYLQGDTIHALPIFEYIYHEYAITYGGDQASWLFHREASLIKHAMCCVWGMQNLVSIGEPDYDIETPEIDHPVAPLLRSIVQAQRTFARNWLVFGRMLRPADVETATERIELWWPPNTPRMRMIWKDIPHLLHASWRSQAGTVAHVLCNWSGTAEPVTVTLTDATTGARLVGEDTAQALTVENGRTSATIPARAVMMVEEVG